MNEISKTIKQGENEKIEFKKHFCDEVIETLTAMVNSTGGQVYLGINDRGKISGADMGKESIQKWLNEIKHKTDFKIIPDVEEIKVGTKKIIVFSIPEYPNKPIPFKGRYYKRIKNSNHLMTIDEIVSYNLPKPKIKEISGGINVDIFGEKSSEKTVEKTVEKIFILLQKNPLITQDELSKKTNLSRRGIEWNLKALKEKCRIKRIGPDKGGYWKVIAK